MSWTWWIYLELGLFDTNIVIAMQALATEIFGPISVLIIKNKQSEATIFVEDWTRCTLNGRTYEYRIFLVIFIEYLTENHGNQCLVKF